MVGSKYIKRSDYKSIIDSGWDIRELKRGGESMDQRVFVITKSIAGEKKIYIYQRVRRSDKLVLVPDSYRFFKKFFLSYKNQDAQQLNMNNAVY